MIQAAIDRVSALTPDANGFRGAVLLKKGVYLVEGSLYIRASGVVLRGEGNGVDGTVLNATQKSQHTLIILQEAAGVRAEVVGNEGSHHADLCALQALPVLKWPPDIRLQQEIK